MPALRCATTGVCTSYTLAPIASARMSTSVKPFNVEPPGSVEQPLIVRLPDGTLKLYFLVRDNGGTDQVACAESGDHGLTWSEPEDQLRLPSGIGYWSAPHPLVDRTGEVHLFLLNDRGTGVLGEPMAEGGRKPRTRAERLLDIWHTRSSHDRSQWQPAKRIWEGYTGSLNSVIQIRGGRILLPFHWRTGQDWLHRGRDLDAFTFHGTSHSTVMYSDNGGDTWHQGTRDLRVWAPMPSYGAVEPVIIQLEDGRVWMLMRTQTGRFYESFSKDGANWSPARATRIISSDSPAGLVRLLDGRLVMLWNACQRFPYAYGGRHVLHAAISEDEGQTWRGCREAARDPLRHEPPPTARGDFGTAYPFPAVTADNRVIYRTGQGRGRLQIMIMDPDWLCETRQSSDFTDGLEEWSVFGTRGVELLPHPDRSEARALRVTKAVPGRTAAAVWNFPAGKTGILRIRLRTEPRSDHFRITITDHYSTPFDTEDEFHSMFNLLIGPGPDSRLTEASRLEPGRWHLLELGWDCAARRECDVRLDGHAVTALPLLRETDGVNYLRIVSTAEERDPAGLWIQSTEAEITPG